MDSSPNLFQNIDSAGTLRNCCQTIGWSYKEVNHDLVEVEKIGCIENRPGSGRPERSTSVGNENRLVDAWA